VVPSLGEVEPQRVDVTIARAEQVVLLDQAGCFVNKGVTERVTYRRGDARHKRGTILVVPSLGEVKPQRVDVAIGRPE